MPSQIQSMLSRMMDFIRGFSVAQRTIAVIGIAALVLGGIALSSWLGRPSYAPLFTGLQATDASAIVDQLSADGVKYELTDGGATVMVPQDQVYAERLKAAANKLPSSSTSGYALLDKMGVTSSQFQQDVTYKQAMEEELANTIEAMNGVKTASVKLAIPEQTVFTAQAADPTASVFIATDGNATLSDDQVQAIVHLTSASVPSMKPTDVSVVDADGNVLSTVGGDPSGGTDKQQATYETKTQAAIQTMLDRIVGPGNSTVAVSADVSNQTAQQTSEVYSVPTGSPAATESSQSESYTGDGGQTAGILGPDNIAVPNGTATNGAYSSSQVDKTNALDKTTTTTSIPSGQVTRQTVSVAISQKAAGGVNMQSLQALVESAAGYNQARGDVVTVQSMGFSGSTKSTAQNALDQSASQADAARRASLIRTGIIAGAIALVVIALVVLLLGRRRRHDGAVLDYQEVVDENELSALLPGFEPQPLLPELELDPEAESIDAKKRDISALAAGDPSRTAALLRGMMDQEVGS